MSTPSAEYFRTHHRAAPRLLKGLDAGVQTLIGYHRRRGAVLAELTARAAEVDRLADSLRTINSHQLQERLHACRDQFQRGGRSVESAVVPALAAIREAADRQLGLRPFTVQLVGALALHRGCLAEMATGEGKTLTAGLAAVLAGWTRRPCHIVTVNDYLVERDAAWLRPLYHFAGVTVGTVTGPMSPADRREGYARDITYATSKEILADFLRDRLHLGPLENPFRRLVHQWRGRATSQNNPLVMRGLSSAIVDEADSVLIDEAVTPLIIATPHKNEALRDVVTQAHEIVADLAPETDYQVRSRFREIELTRAGLEKLRQRCASLPGLWRGPERSAELARQALAAREFFHRDRQYVLDQGKIVIVDEFTGRPMPQRTWRQGMHQAIEAKEGLPLSDPSDTIARMSFQRFFRLYDHLAGMTGTAAESARELWQIYRLPVVRIPTHRPCIRQHWPDRVFRTEEEKWQAIVDDIARLHGSNRPILVGTRSVAASEHLAARLHLRHLPVNLLNAVRHQEEAAIISGAGEAGSITIATNMAGRGTDIKLGPHVDASGGLHVIATERHESERVDRQLFGRAARQGDPGSAQAYVSLEDELLRRHLPGPVHRWVKKTFVSGWPGGVRAALAAIRLAQRRAQALAYRQRQSVLRADEWLEDSLSFAGPGT